MTKSTLSWAFYDWANSAFATTVMAGFFPLFFKAYWANPGDPHASTFYLGMANSLASIVVAALAPLLGSIADRATSKKKFLITFTVLGVFMTGGLSLVARGHWQAAVLFYITATIGFSGANIFYDSLLPAVAKRREFDFVSALGYALGYLGGGLLFAANVLMYLKPHLFGLPDGATAIKVSFASVAVWWAVFSIPLLLFVDEPRYHKEVPLRQAISLGWRQLCETARQIRHLKVVGTFLLAYWLYIDGVDTIVRMAVDYGMSLGFPQGSLIKALLLVQFIAFPAALAYGWLGEKIGPKPAILIAIAAYGGTTFLAYFMRTESHFYALAVMIGLFQGGIQALSRSLYARIIPAEKSAEFFGFYNMMGKFAAVIGPALMGTVTLVTGNPRVGILSILVLFLGGGAILMWVDVEEGQRMANEAL